MKRFLILLSLLFCNVVFADTINLHWLNEDGTVYENSTCVIDSDLILPSTPPTKYGYTFTGWKMINYTPLDYLESTGTQYIDTGYIAHDINTSITIKFSNPTAWIFGSVETYGRSDDFGIAVGAIRFGTQYTIQGLNFSDNIYTINVNKTGYTVNGQKTYWQNTPVLNCQKNIFLFWANGSGVGKSGKIYFFKIYDNDVLVRDFIPVLDYNGVPCMLDKVEQKFYYNAGTGQFIAGPLLQ